VHGWHHRLLVRRAPREVRGDLRRAHGLVGDIAGSPPRWYRPPYGVASTVGCAPPGAGDESGALDGLGATGPAGPPPTRSAARCSASSGAGARCCFTTRTPARRPDRGGPPPTPFPAGYGPGRGPACGSAPWRARHSSYPALTRSTSSLHPGRSRSGEF
jgi:peptidoglycan/xylan/chitin deacetylase (PgdA/CDA1 family)